MAILGAPEISNEQPEFTIDDFKFWMPIFSKAIDTKEGQVMYNNLYPIALEKIQYSIFGADWKKAMSLCIAHYATIIGNQQATPAPGTIAQAAAMGTTKGIITTAGIGQFNQTFDVDRSLSNTQDAIFWNQTQWGAELYNLFMSKPILSMIVVTPGPIGQRNNYRNGGKIFK